MPDGFEFKNHRANLTCSRLKPEIHSQVKSHYNDHNRKFLENNYSSSLERDNCFKIHQ